MRVDLAALTPESAAALSNRGLVKRALREIAEGLAPVVEEDAAGTVRATFAHGVVAELPPGRSLAEGTCTCGAPTVCRHRVAAALLYAARTEATGSEPAPDDDELGAFAGPAALRRAKAARTAGLDAEVVRGRETVVRLPSATVRFLSPALALARCECAAGPRCEHVVLALHALREWPEGSGRVRLGRRAEGLDEATRRAVDGVAALAADLIDHGAAGVSEGVLARLRVTRDRLDDAGLTWLATLVDDLDEVLGDYQARSARYQPARFAALVAEALARIRAASAADAALDPRGVLGLGERRETTLTTVRVVALGARAASEGTAREVVVYLADPASGVVLAHRRRWRGADETLGDAADVAERTVITGLRVRELALAEAQLRDLRRSATGHVRWTVFRRGLAAATPLGGPGAAPGRAEDAWRALPEPLRVPDVAALGRRRRGDRPGLLAPRLATAGVHVVEVSACDGLRYAPGRQALLADVRDAAGNVVRVVREHRSVAPRALETLARVLPHARLVAGELRAVAGGFELEPCGVVTEALVVPDLERDAPRLDVPLVTAEAPPDPLSAAVQAAGRVIDDAAHLGLQTLPRSWHARAATAASELRATGFTRLAEDVARLAAAPAPGTWTSAAIRRALTAERIGGP